MLLSALTPRVSVIVPLYNKAPYVRRTLDSISQQTFSDFEVIVVDDGSTDHGPEIVRAFDDERVRLITQANLGPGAARNRALDEARGDLIAFLDADDEWLPDYLADGVDLIDRAGDKVASITCGYFTEPGSNSHTTMWQRRGVSEGAHTIDASTSAPLLVHMLAYMSPCTTLARASLFRRWGGFYDRDRCTYAEDAHLWLKVLLNETVAFTLKPLARLHIEASSLSKNLPAARPIEPFLLNPEEIERACPPHLQELLKRVLAVRAFKTACVLGYWGRWREARAITRQFAIEGAWRLPKYFLAEVCSTPIGAGLGWVARRLALWRV